MVSALLGGALGAAPSRARADEWSLEATLAPAPGATFQTIAGGGSTLVVVGADPQQGQQVSAFRQVDGQWIGPEVVPPPTGFTPDLIDPEGVSDDAVITLSNFNDDYIIRILTATWLGDGWSAPEVVAHGGDLAGSGWLGEALAMRGDRLAITVSRLDQESPECPFSWQILAFRRSGERWEADGIAEPPSACSMMASTFPGLAVDGDRIVQLVSRGDQHVAHVFRGEEGAWKVESALTTPGAGYDRVAIAGSQLVLGAADAEEGAGILDVFALGDKGWVLETRLAGTGEGPIAIDGDVIAAAASPELVRVFARGEGWVEEAHLSHHLPTQHAFALQGSTLAIVDRPEADPGAALVLVYRRTKAPVCEGDACDGEDEGCACRASGHQGSLTALLFAGLLFASRRRGRGTSASTATYRPTSRRDRRRWLGARRAQIGHL
ncbi:MAG: hypothetical protein H6710_17340 [Myxococcales bacterium]|nr:hypothetical protein [Myxococcales bacterium]